METYRRLSDEALMQRYVQRQDRMALLPVYDRYGHLVAGICLRYLKNKDAALEATRQVFICLADELFSFQTNDLKGLLVQLAHKQCTTWKAEPDATGYYPYWQQEPVPAAACEHISEPVLTSLFSQLPKPVQQCLRLFYEQKLTGAEISAITGHTPEKVRHYLYEGKYTLSGAFKKEGGI